MGLFTSPNVPVIFVRFGTKLALFIQHYVAAGDSFSTFGPCTKNALFLVK